MSVEHELNVARGMLAKLATAAQQVVDETDRIHDDSPWPLKYRTAYRAITELRSVLASLYGSR